MPSVSWLPSNIVVTDSLANLILFIFGLGLCRAKRVLENRQYTDGDRMSQLEVTAKEAQASATEADKKYEEVKLSSWYQTIFAVFFKLINLPFYLLFLPLFCFGGDYYTTNISASKMQ